jgi:hypothetical protein
MEMTVARLIQILQTVDGEAEVQFSEGGLTTGAFSFTDRGPCEGCGTTDGVKVVPTGSLARLTPMCDVCLSLLKAKTEAYHERQNA